MFKYLITFIALLIPVHKWRKDFKKKYIKRNNGQRIMNDEKIKLIMTLVCKDEIDIIEQHILFHHNMGVDGYIVTDNNSTDGTREILQKYKDKGIILEIIDEPCKTHMHSVWVDKMVMIAKKKYKATWVINSDSDEFWYAHHQNLKKDIALCGKANVLYFYFRNFIPDKTSEDFFNSTWFVNRPLPKFEAEKFGITNQFYLYDYLVPKVMHKTKGFIHVLDGNHGVDIENPDMVEPANISLYHYGIRHYRHFENKVTKGYASIKDHPQKSIGHEWRRWYEEFYQHGKLQEIYEENFSMQQLETLKDVGCVVNDPSVRNFMKYKNII